MVAEADILGASLRVTSIKSSNCHNVMFLTSYFLFLLENIDMISERVFDDKFLLVYLFIFRLQRLLDIYEQWVSGSRPRKHPRRLLNVPTRAVHGIVPALFVIILCPI